MLVLGYKISFHIERRINYGISYSIAFVGPELI